MARPLRTILAQPASRVAILGAAVGAAVMTMIMTATPLAMRQRRMSQAVVDRMPKDARSLIDIGCGDGTYTAELPGLRQLPPKVSVQ